MIYDLAGFYLFFAISSSTSCARSFSSHSFLHHHFSATLFACYLLQTLCCSTVCVCVLHNISPVWGFLYSCNSSCWSYLSLTVVVFFFGVHNVDSMSCVLFLSFSHCILVLKFRTCVNVKYRDLRWETTQLLHIRSMYCICECRFLKIIRNSHLTGHSINFTLAFNALHDAIYISTLQFVQQDRTQH